MFRRGEKPGSGLRNAFLAAASERGVGVSELDVTSLVGEVAGEVYKVLESAGGSMQMVDLKQRLENRGPITVAAVGWLLREDKVVLKIVDAGAVVSLK